MQGRSHRPQHDSRVFKRAMNEQGNALLNLSGKASGGRARSILPPAKPYKRTLPPPAERLTAERLPPNAPAERLIDSVEVITYIPPWP